MSAKVLPSWGVAKDVILEIQPFCELPNKTDSSFIFKLSLMKGQWYTFKPIKLDHYQSVGHMISNEKRGMLDSVYINHAQLLWSLPKY